MTRSVVTRVLAVVFLLGLTPARLFGADEKVANASAEADQPAASAEPLAVEQEAVAEVDAEKDVAIPSESTPVSKANDEEVVFAAELDPGDENPSRPRIGVALAGGGAKGIAHVGVLQVLEELRVPIDYIAGTSMGAVVGGLYASGMPLEDIEELVLTLDWEDVMEDQPTREYLSFRRKQEDSRYLFNLQLGVSRKGISIPAGIKSGQKLFFLLRSLTLPVLHIDDFDDLPIPFRALGANITNGEQVVLDHGDLAKAIRTSMSLPGIFTPMELDGLILVDGGIVNNVPVDVAQEMGADMVIAVDVGRPLDLVEKQFSSFITVTTHLTALLTRGNMRQRLEQADMVIRPDVGGFGTLEFGQAAEILRLGVEEARNKAEALKPYAMEEEAYQQHRLRQILLPRDPPVVHWVRIEGNKRVDERIFHNLLHIEEGQPLDLEALKSDMSRIFGLGDFQTITYNLDVDDEGRYGLVITAVEKPWGPNYMQLGLRMNSDFQGQTGFGLLTSLNMTRINPKGAEWRNDLLLGEQRGLRTEFYQPTSFTGRAFVAPSLLWVTEVTGFWVDGERTAELDTAELTLRLDAGRNLGTSTEMRLGYRYTLSDGSLRSGFLPPGVPTEEIEDVSSAGLEFRLTRDGLDSPSIPRRGDYLSLDAFFSHDYLGGDFDFLRIEGSASIFRGPGRHTYFGRLWGGLSPGYDLPVLQEFTMGGFLSFSGLSDNEIRGQQGGVARAGYYYQLWRLGSPIGGDVVVGGWLEAGQLWEVDQPVTFDDLLLGYTLFIGADTMIGPVYAGMGQAEGGNYKFYLVIGRRL